MTKILPRHASIVGTHPLFGPSSAAKSLKGHHIVISPIRIPFRELQILHTSLRKAGLRVHHMSSKDHDKLMAQTLFLTQFIGRSAGRIDPPRSTFTTPNYRLLNTIIERTRNDSFELFKDVYRYNPYAERILKNVIRETLRLERQIA
jgi:prephenate dehydrogenase